jgi:hypothetical protein
MTRMQRRAQRRRRRRIALLVTAVAVVGTLAVSGAAGSGKGDAAVAKSDRRPSSTAPGSSAASRASSTTAPATVRTPDTGTRENVAFFYQGIKPTTDFSRLGPASIIIAGKAAPAYTPNLIHRSGAKAYRGIQMYWFSTGTSYDGLEIPKRQDWAFCLQGAQPLLARTDSAHNPWVYVDGNERGVQQAFAQHLAELKAQGWDGVFFDRGFAAMTGIDDQPNPAWNKVSTCTGDPVSPNATMSDAYLALASQVRAAGLDVVVNYGMSPFDPRHPMRPDPRDPRCNPVANTTCTRLDDAWKATNWVLDEAIAHVEDLDWDADFRANQSNEVGAAAGRHVMGLITNSNLAGRQDRDTAVYAFARVKLFPIPVGINTGDDNCPHSAPGSLCNRHGVYPELIGLELGAPVDARPSNPGCRGTDPHCMWYRRYANGASVLNVSPRPASVTFALGTQGCRYVKDLGTGQVLGQNACIDQVTVLAGPYTGHPLAYATHAW